MGMVKFIECTFDEWNSLQKDPDTLYFVSDKNTVYKGETPYAGTTYSAGDGLSLIGTEFSVADGGITTTKVADGAITLDKLAPGVVVDPDIPDVSQFITQQEADEAYASKTHTHNNATAETAGFMSATDKEKLDGLDTTLASAIGAEATEREEQDELLQAAIDTKLQIDDLIAGDNVSFDTASQAGKVVISATDTKYSAGTGLGMIGNGFYLLNGGVGLNQLADGAVSGSKIGDGAVLTDKIKDGAVTDAKIAGMSANKLVGTIPSSNLPSYVDDVVEYTSLQEFPETGESGKIYVDTTANTTYRWSGTEYVAIGSSLALGETSATAFRGDYGKVAYDHAQAKGSAFANGLYKITTNAEGHVTEATAVVKEDITALGISENIPHATDTVYGTVKFASDEDFNAFMGI